MRKTAILLLMLWWCHSVSAQTTWKQLWEFELSENAVWDVDQAGNVYLYSKEIIQKIDTTGKVRLTQSAKSFGNISKIDASNWLKIAVFSEEQQQICYLDNALAIQPNCIELAEAGVTLAVNFATSQQTDRIWVYDQLNSELQLITMRTNQRQIVQNLRSLIELGNIRQVFEYENVLHITDDLGQLALFDNFGTFIGGSTVGGHYLQAYAKGLLIADGKIILAKSDDLEEEATFFPLPETSSTIRQFHYTGKLLYVEDEHKRIICFKPA